MATSQFIHSYDSLSFPVELIGNINLVLLSLLFDDRDRLQASTWNLKMVFQSRCHLGKRSIKRHSIRGYIMYKDLEQRDRSLELIEHRILHF